MLTFATRPSPLARWQTEYIVGLLQAVWLALTCQIEVITTRGDRLTDTPLPRIGGKGLFTLELEEALRRGRVDAAVHSLKDLPTEEIPGLTIAAIPRRADPRDAWICPAGHTLQTIPPAAVVGTSSIRRRAQILARRPDLDIRPIRGNVDTRMRKVREGQYDAIVLAAAGVTRLGLQAHITEMLPLEVMLPAAGQGALAVQCRTGDQRTLDYLRAIEDPSTRRAVTAERAFLQALGGGCSLPVGAHATANRDTITLRGVVLSPDGAQHIEVLGQDSDPLELGASLAREALARGAATLLEVAC